MHINLDPLQPYDDLETDDIGPSEIPFERHIL